MYNDLEYSFFWSGKPEGERREAGVGFTIKNDIVTKLTEIPRPVLVSKDNFAAIISMKAPTMTNPDKNMEAFYNQQPSVLSGIPRTDNLLLIGYFNARIGRKRKCQVAFGYGQTWDWEMQLQWRASNGSVL